MDLPAPHDEDLHAWALHQAQVLRRMRASGLAVPNDFDLEHVAEEIEDLGNEQRFQVEGNLEQALAHLLKLALLPEDAARRHWAKEVVAFLSNARRRYRPSMRQLIAVDDLWSAACRGVRAEFGLGRDAPPELPAELPLTLEALLDREAEPMALAEMLAAAIRR